MARQANGRPKYSFPKERIKVLLLENISPTAVELFEQENYQIQTLPKSLSEAELMRQIEDISILGIRSSTEITEPVLAKARRLLVVGAFCIGTNQIDLAAAANRGVAVFNAPYSNSRSVVELVLAEIIALTRRLTDKNQSSHAGRWDKSAVGAHEIRGLQLGIVGYGNIGSQLSVLAENLGMRVGFYDIQDKLPLGNAKPYGSLDQLLKTSDVVTVHVDGRPANNNLFSEAQFAAMKPGSIFINLSRGFVVNEAALKKHLLSGRLVGAGIDVFPKEPKSKNDRFHSVLQGLPNVILTPHVAGSTEEAQAAIGTFVADKIINFINQGSTAMSVNLPQLALPLQLKSYRLILIHRNEPGVLAKVNTILAADKVNVNGQYLGTQGEIGYVITDINKSYPAHMISELRALPESIRLRVLY